MAASDRPPALQRDAAPTPAVTAARSQPEQQAFDLAPLEAAPPPSPLARRAPAGQLWLCLYLPALPLEASAVAEDTPLYAVFEEQSGVRQVLQASPAAREAGVGPGLSVNAALALLPELQLEERDTAQEALVLKELAGWAERYTSFAVMEPPSLLLLEIAASLRLFNGLKALRRQIVAELIGQGYSALPAIAPTPLAATWLARAGRRRCVTRTDRLTSELARLPLGCLDWPASVTNALQGMGLSSVGELLRLPRDGFARRFGAQRLLQLDRALGRLPDPREHYRAAPRFCHDIDLDSEQSDSELLLAACDELLQHYERFALTRQRASQRLYFIFYHLQHAATSLTVGCLQAERSAERWLKLLRIRLEQLELPAPVISIRLRASDGQAMTADSARFGFAAEPGERTSIAPLIERLSARIGERAVHGVTTLAEHRPDQAWCQHRALAAAPQCRPPECLQRPLWMLDTPELLDKHAGKPAYQGPLVIDNGPERIETGWWDAAGVARDYYVARNPAGIWLWVFRDRRAPANWYLHGIFG